jgi:hypothetical protein
MQLLGARFRNWNSGNTVHVSHLCNSVIRGYYRPILIVLGRIMPSPLASI